MHGRNTCLVKTLFPALLRNLTAYRLIRSYTGTGEYSNIDCGIVGEILAGYHSVAGIVSEVNYMLDSIGVASY